MNYYLVQRFGAAVTVAVVLLSSSGANSQETSTSPTACATVLTPSYSSPVVAAGWKAQLIATDLTRPRGMKFDSNGGLLVVQVTVGITHLTFEDGGGTCLSVKSTKALLEEGDGVSTPSSTATLQCTYTSVSSLTPASSTTALSFPRTARPSMLPRPKPSTAGTTMPTPSPPRTRSC